MQEDTKDWYVQVIENENDGAEKDKIAIMQWATGLIFVAKYLRSDGDHIFLEKVVSLMEDETFVNEYRLVPQPLPISLIGGNLDGCVHVINTGNLAIWGFYPADSDHEIVKLYNRFWEQTMPEQAQPAKPVEG